MPTTPQNAKKQKIVDLFTKMPPVEPVATAAAAPAGHWVQGSHNIVFSGNVSLHLVASDCPARREGCDE